jgi:N-acetylmuramoyl-L-alanine amidase
MRIGRLAGIRLGGALLFMVVAACFAAPAPVLAQQLLDLKWLTGKGAAKDPGDKTTRTRFIIGLEQAVDFEVAALENPNRVFVDLPEVKVVLPDPLGDTPAGLIKGFRHGMSGPGKSRVVIDVTGPVVVEKYSIEKAAEGKFARIVIDLVSAAEATVTEEARSAMRAGALGLGAGSNLQPPTPKPAQSPQARAANSFKPVIVIDPGHGGEDGGARKFGTLEKDVVLSFSLKLREKLNETGRYKVLMTREKDVFVPLEERREFAERNQAALFIAIHADYAARATARGATIYSLRPQLSESLRRAAKGLKENVLSSQESAQIKNVGGDVNAVRDMLADLAQLDVERKRERTDALVQSVLSFMGATTNMMENPDRKAAFVVLQTTSVPSILLELGYMTSVQDAQQLKSDQWRDSVSGSLVTAIDNYLSNHVARLPM